MPFIPKTPQDFITAMAAAGAPSAAREDLPLPAMIACACLESGYGTSDIYLATGCPFNLQKPPEWAYPKCEIKYLPTVNKEGENPRPAPFCVAATLEEAGRLWCEWIKHWPNRSARDAVLSLSKQPALFASNLHLVGFAEAKKSKCEEFGKLIDKLGLLKYDARTVAKDK
jgi:hypothetical protein